MPRSRTARRLAPWALLLWCLPVLAADDAKLACEILENGSPASGTVALLQGTAEVAHGVCGKPIAVPPGLYTAVLSLDGVLDGPELRQEVTIAAGKTTKLGNDFETGLLEIKIQREGHDTAGMAVIRKGDRQIGTLGSGVAAHLSVGAYQVVARYRAQQKNFDNVVIAKGQRTRLDAVFE
jgi:hypothetical protein